MLAKERANGALKKKAHVPKYLPKMDLAPFPPKFRQLKLQSYTEVTSAYQHVVHFNTVAASLARIANCDALKIRLFVSTFQEAAFDWFMRFPDHSITSWASLEERFLLHLYEKDHPITMAHLYNTKQGDDDSSQDFVKTWHVLSYKCPNALSHKAIVGLCKNNLKAEVLSLIVGFHTKTMAQLIEVAVEAKGILAEVKKGSLPLRAIVINKDAAVKGKNKKEVFSTAQGKKEVLNIQASTRKAPISNKTPKKAQGDAHVQREELEKRKAIKYLVDEVIEAIVDTLVR